jgi:hypothetical protein
MYSVQIVEGTEMRGSKRGYGARKRADIARDNLDWNRENVNPARVPREARLVGRIRYAMY